MRMRFGFSGQEDGGLRPQAMCGGGAYFPGDDDGGPIRRHRLLVDPFQELGVLAEVADAQILFPHPLAGVLP